MSGIDEGHGKLWHGRILLDSALNILLFARRRASLSTFAYTIHNPEKIADLPVGHVCVTWSVVVVGKVLCVRHSTHVSHLPVINTNICVCGSINA